MPPPESRLRIFLSGSEWFDSRPGGLNRYFTEYAKALADREDVLVSAGAFGEPPDELGHSRGDAGMSWSRRLQAVVREAWQMRDADVLDVHFAPYGLLPIVLRKLRRKTSLVHFHGPWAEESAVYGRGRVSVMAKRLVEAITYRSADQCVVLSRAFADLLHQRYGVPRERITVIPGATRMREAPKQLEPPELSYGLCVRRLEARMGIEDLIDAWRIVTDAVPDARLDIVGSGPLESALNARVDALGLRANVIFHGRVPDCALEDLYAGAAFSVVPSRTLEGFGLIVLESLAQGTPVIATECGGMPEILTTLDPSLIVPIGEPKALAQRVVDAFNGRLPTPSLCRSHAAQFSWDTLVHRHAQLFTALVAARS